MSALGSAVWLLYLCNSLALSGGTVGQEHGPGVKVFVEEDSDAVLPCMPSTKEDIVAKIFDWKKDGQKKKDVFMYNGNKDANRGQDLQFKGRVSHFEDQLQNGNASIKIQNTKVTDSGNYSCIFPHLQYETFNIELVVGRILKDRSGETRGASPRPYITIVKAAQDGSLLLLQCEVHGASPKPKVEWLDSSRNILPAEKRQDTERENHFYITVLTTVTKTDHFRCVATQEEIGHQTFAETFVPFIEAAPEPNIRILNETVDGLLLQCDVRGASSEPKVEWKDGAGNILPAEEPQVSERGGRYYVTLNITVTKTDRYRCEVTQEEISHQTFAETFVPFIEAAPEPNIRILNETVDGLLLQCDVRGASSEPKVEWKDGAGNILPAEEPQVSERGGRYYVTLNITVTKTDRYRCEVTQEEISHQTRAETFVFISGSSSSKEAIGWLFGGFVLGAAVLAVVLVGLVATKCITIIFNKGPCRQRDDYEAASKKQNNSPL